MFKLAEKKTLTWPVTVNIPQDGGKTTKATFTGEFEVLDQDEMFEVTAEGGDMLERALVGWKGYTDHEGSEIPFSDEARKKLFVINYVRVALFTAYGEINNGRAAARKN